MTMMSMGEDEFLSALGALLMIKLPDACVGELSITKGKDAFVHLLDGTLDGAAWQRSVYDSGQGFAIEFKATSRTKKTEMNCGIYGAPMTLESGYQCFVYTVAEVDDEGRVSVRNRNVLADKLPPIDFTADEKAVNPESGCEAVIDAFVRLICEGWWNLP